VRLTTAIALALRARRIDVLAYCLLGLVGGVILIPQQVRVPGRSFDEVLVPLAPMVVALGYSVTDGSLGRLFLEQRRRGWRLRRVCLFVLTVLISGASGLVCAWVFVPALDLMVARNCVLFVGIVAAVGPRADDAGAVLAVLYGVVSWIVGSRGAGRDPLWWALPLAAGNDMPSWIAAMALASFAVIRVSTTKRGTSN
jgi:hypothetical protein